MHNNPNLKARDTMGFRPEYDANTGATATDPSTYKIVPLRSDALEPTPSPVASAPEDDTPVRRPNKPSELVTRPKQGATRPTKQEGTTMLPAAYEIPEHVPLQPTMAMPAPQWAESAGPIPESVTTVMPSAELESAPPEEIFDRVAWVADRLASCADALGADGRPRTAALLRGLASGMTMGTTPGALERVGARLIQRALLADAGVADVDDEAVARLLLDTAADVLVGVDPTRKAARAIARQLDVRATECRQTAERCRVSGNALGVEHHTARADELAVQAREIRKAHR